MLIFYLFIFLYPNILIIQITAYTSISNSYQNSHCKSISDCFNCSMSQNTLKATSCVWSGNSCIETTSTSYFSHWYDTFLDCEQDKKSMSQISSYCSYNTSTHALIITNLTLSERAYSMETIYCVWTINNIESSRELIINFNQSDESVSNTDEFALEIQYEDYSMQINLIENIPNAMTERLVKEITFRYFGKGKKSEIPFVLLLKYKREKNLNLYILLLIIIGIIVLIIVMICLFWLWEKKITYANTNTNAEINQSHIENTNNEINQTIFIGGAINYNSNSNKEINNKLCKGEIYLQSYPILKFNNNNYYQFNSCTICLEGFEVKNEIIKLNCRHIFHFNCILKWVKKEVYNVKCPNCNKEIGMCIKEEDVLVIKDCDKEKKQRQISLEVNRSSLNEERTQNQNQNLNEITRILRGNYN